MYDAFLCYEQDKLFLSSSQLVAINAKELEEEKKKNPGKVVFLYGDPDEAPIPDGPFYGRSLSVKPRECPASPIKDWKF